MADLDDLKLSSKIQRPKFDENYICTQGTHYHRHVYQNVQYYPNEKEAIQQVKNYLANINFIISDDIEWSDALYLKCIYGLSFKIKETGDYIIQYVKWLKMMKTFTNNPLIFDLLKKGGIYQLGRDKFLRPIIIFNVVNMALFNIDIVLESLAYVLSNVYNKMCEPYYIEKFVILIDVCDKGIFQVPMRQLIQIINYSNNYFCQMSYRTYVVNISSSLSKGFSVISKLLTDQQNESQLQKLKELESQIKKIFINFKKISIEINQKKFMEVHQSLHSNIGNNNIKRPPINTYENISKNTSFYTCLEPSQNNQNVQSQLSQLDQNINQNVQSQIPQLDQNINQNVQQIQKELYQNQIENQGTDFDESYEMDIPQENKSNQVKVQQPQLRTELFKLGYQTFINKKNEKIQNFMNYKTQQLQILQNLKDNTILTLKQYHQHMNQKMQNQNSSEN